MLRIFRALAALALPAALGAQERTLSWPRIDVDARLDAEGRLHVVERQRMRLDGAWNGGERRFAVAASQRFDFESIVRIDSATGARVPMREGALDAVDGWARDGRTVRWRSRRADDPPFVGALRTYELRFRYGDILVADDARRDRFVLDHDFAFADREGAIDTLVLTLDVDPAWRTDSVRTLRWVATGLAPGRGFGVDVPLVRVAATPPSAVRLPAPPALAWGFVAAGVAAALAALARLALHDRGVGRFAPVPPPEAVTPDFLERECLAHLPEVVGAAWDARTAAPEVAALLARLVQEGALGSRVQRAPRGTGGDDVLHLELRVDRATLRAHERRLVDALFAPNARRTSTETVRRMYRTKGFDPARVIEGGVASLVHDALPSGDTPVVASRLETRAIPIALAAAAVACWLVGALRGGFPDLAAAMLAIVASLPFALVAFVAGRFVYRPRVTGLLVPWLVLAAGLVVGAIVVGVLVAGDPFGLHPSPATIAGAACWVAFVAWLATLGARTDQPAERLAWRRRLAAVRAFFVRELDRPAPQLDDAWYPWMLAFGLGPHVDKWFRAFGGERAREASASARPVSSPSPYAPSGGGEGFRGFGGGGGFSGGGGGADFGSAVSAFAASVPSPSSSSSSGSSSRSSSSSSSSSGGGGGGGW